MITVSGSQAGRNPYRTTSISYDPAVLEGTRWSVMDIAQVYPIQVVKQDKPADVGIDYTLGSEPGAVLK